ncbi:hypothetical protein BB560_001194 [Smittium megazygosporum]|uniref:Myb/SANT-like DNA-binding domain-containing protein n=1 Tax=Smittium megazygosporum TaxID=133381 RepID=A0A2T9ZIA2_9FUNG|nr:hypothetical protein BB560_001194 [Smittium megazygosporum]
MNVVHELNRPGSSEDNKYDPKDREKVDTTKCENLSTSIDNQEVKRLSPEKNTLNRTKTNKINMSTKYRISETTEAKEPRHGKEGNLIHKNKPLATLKGPCLSPKSTKQNESYKKGIQNVRSVEANKGSIEVFDDVKDSLLRKKTENEFYSLATGTDFRPVDAASERIRSYLQDTRDRTTDNPLYDERWKHNSYNSQGLSPKVTSKRSTNFVVPSAKNPMETAYLKNEEVLHGKRKLNDIPSLERRTQFDKQYLYKQPQTEFNKGYYEHKNEPEGYYKYNPPYKYRQEQQKQNISSPEDTKKVEFDASCAFPRNYNTSNKQLTPKFRRSRNWGREETTVLLRELFNIVKSMDPQKRDLALRSSSSFEIAASRLKESGYDRNSQACLVRWRNVLRIYKTQRREILDSGGDIYENPFAMEIETIFRNSTEQLAEYDEGERDDYEIPICLETKEENAFVDVQKKYTSVTKTQPTNPLQPDINVDPYLSRSIEIGFNQNMYRSSGPRDYFKRFTKDYKDTTGGYNRFYGPVNSPYDPDKMRNIKDNIFKKQFNVPEEGTRMVQPDSPYVQQPRREGDPKIPNLRDSLNISTTRSTRLLDTQEVSKQNRWFSFEARAADLERKLVDTKEIANRYYSLYHDLLYEVQYLKTVNDPVDNQGETHNKGSGSLEDDITTSFNIPIHFSSKKKRKT